MMKTRLTILLAAVFCWVLGALAQSVDAQAYYLNKEGVEEHSNTIPEGEAPLTVEFRANPTDMEGCMPSYEWHFRRDEKGEGMRELFVRYEENTTYTFEESGTYHVVLKTRLEQDGAELDSMIVTVSIAESKLEFPNAFSPNNGDELNNKYQAKEGYKSIVQFHAIIINRWGQKIFEWYDPADGWDGTYKGRDVKEGVYYVIVSAKGADGKEYNIRKDVNLLRGFTEGGRTSGEQ